MEQHHAQQFASLCSVRPALSDFDASPILLTGNPWARQQVLAGSHDPAVKVAINGTVVTFETELFKGHLVQHFRGMPDTDDKVFEGRKRNYMGSFQGKFKRPVAVDDLMRGQEFYWDQNHKPPVNLTLARLLLKAAATIRSSRAHVKIDDGYMCSLALVASGCQILNVSLDGQQPALMDATEDARLLSPALADPDGLPLPPHKRKKLMESPAFTKGLTFGTEHVYTFVTWLHQLDYKTLHVNLGRFLGSDLCRWLPPGAPLTINMKDIKTGEYVINVALWHRRIVEKAERWDAAKTKGGKQDSEHAAAESDPVAGCV